jgi:hypothetical protein
MDRYRQLEMPLQKSTHKNGNNIMKKKYGTPYPESLGPKTFCILGFSEI